MSFFSCILAMDQERGMSLRHKLPWRSLMVGKADMQFFREKTQDAVVVMGSKTWDSLNRCPLESRVAHIVVTRQEELTRAHVVRSLDEALQLAQDSYPQKKIFVIGGAKLFATAFQHPACQEIFLTQIPGKFQCDCLLTSNLNILCENFTPHQEVLRFKQFCFNTTTIRWVRKTQETKEREGLQNFPEMVVEGDTKEELEYLKLMQRLLSQKSTLVPNRTGIACAETLCQTLRFSLQNNTLPLLTSKLTFFHSVCTELLWFLRGEPNISFLHKHDVHIWDANTSAEFLKKRKLNYQPGECGPVYGCQWRNFNSQGIDQLKNVIAAIQRVKQNPCDEEARRLLVVAYNPAQLAEMALPPCHLLMQFHVGTEVGTETKNTKGKNNQELNCMMMMRSADLPLGVPFNICSYALLTFILCHLTGLSPGTLHVTMNICSAYENQFSLMEKQINQPIYPFPRLAFSERLNSFTDLDQVAFQAEPEDFIVTNYFHSPSIAYPMAV